MSKETKIDNKDFQRIWETLPFNQKMKLQWDAEAKKEAIYTIYQQEQAAKEPAPAQPKKEK